MEMIQAKDAFDKTCQYGYTQQSEYEIDVEKIIDGINQKINQGKFVYSFAYSDYDEIIIPKLIKTFEDAGYNVYWFNDSLMLKFEWFNIKDEKKEKKKRKRK